MPAVDQSPPLACDVCGKPATCHGEHDGEPTAGCDEHCGHGQEEGRCEPVSAPLVPLPCPCGRGMRAVLRDHAGAPVRLADRCKTCSAEAIRAADASPAETLYRCAGDLCPGLAWKASERPHPPTCASTRRADRFREGPACEDCGDTGTITDPAPDAPGARPPEACVSCSPIAAAPEVHGEPCFCDSFSDCYKDVTGRRPRDEIARWSCARVTQWFHENYIETSPRHFEPRVPFEGEPAAPPPRTLPVTPAERFLAACLRAHQAWNADGAPQCPLDPAVLDIARTLAKYGVLAPTGIVTPAGAALLARVEGAERPTYTRAVALIDALNKDAGGAVVHGMLHAAMIAEANAKDAALAGTTPIDAPPAKEPR